jgi:transcriptional regulator with XRE-family HTH domain
MNRIQEIREAIGMSRAQLAKEVGVSETQIGRLERGERGLSVKQMTRIAEALSCAPSDLIANAVLAEFSDEVEPADFEGLSSIRSAIAGKGLRVYRVTGAAVIDSGVQPGQIVIVDESPQAIKDAKMGDVVLVRIENRNVLVLRVLVGTNMVVTHRPGSNLAIRLDDRAAGMKVVGVVLKN